MEKDSNCFVFSISSGGTGSLNRNGTCFTANECESKGGTSSGSCASGYRMDYIQWNNELKRVCHISNSRRYPPYYAIIGSGV